MQLILQFLGIGLDEAECGQIMALFGSSGSSLSLLTREFRGAEVNVVQACQFGGVSRRSAECA